MLLGIYDHIWFVYAKNALPILASLMTIWRIFLDKR